MKKFNVTFVAKVEDNNNILSSSNDSHEKDVHDLITDVIYDVDDMSIENLNVKEKMIAREDIEAINNLIDSTPTEYSDFVESMIVTKPEDRLMENLLGLCEEVGELHGKIKRVLRDDTNDE